MLLVQKPIVGVFAAITHHYFVIIMGSVTLFIALLPFAKK